MRIQLSFAPFRLWLTFSGSRRSGGPRAQPSVRPDRSGGGQLPALPAGLVEIVPDPGQSSRASLSLLASGGMAPVQLPLTKGTRLIWTGQTQ